MTIAGGQTVAADPIQLQPSADLYVRVNDPKGTRAAAEGKTPGASLMLAVRSATGRLVPIPMTASDKAGFDHHLQVPVGADLLFIAYSGFYSMTDGSGTPISKQNGLARTIHIPPAQAQQKEVVTIQ